MESEPSSKPVMTYGCNTFVWKPLCVCKYWDVSFVVDSERSPADSLLLSSQSCCRLRIGKIISWSFVRVVLFACLCTTLIVYGIRITCTCANVLSLSLSLSLFICRSSVPMVMRHQAPGSGAKSSLMFAIALSCCWLDARIPASCRLPTCWRSWWAVSRGQQAFGSIMPTTGLYLSSLVCWSSPGLHLILLYLYLFQFFQEGLGHEDIVARLVRFVSH